MHLLENLTGLFYISVLCFLTFFLIIPFFVKDNLAADLLDQLRLHLNWVILITIMTLCFFYPGLIFWGLILFVFNTCRIYSSFPKFSISANMKREKPRNLKILSYNLYNRNKSPELALKLIEQADADIVILLESFPNFSSQNTHTLDKKYPYRFPSDAYKNPHRLEWALHSKFPILNSDHEINQNLPLSNHRILHAKIQLKNEIIHFLGIHTRSPKNKKWLKSRNDYFRKLVPYIKKNIPDNIPYIVAGDMNTVPWNSSFHHFQKQCCLNNSDSIFNITKTWPSKFSNAVRFPIDHILFSPHFNCTKKTTLPAAGSDHLPIYTQLN